MKKLCFLGLGSNLNQPEQQLRRALTALSSLPDTHIIRCSRFYKNPSLLQDGQPDFLNAVLALHTQLTPEHLLAHTQFIEQQQGRTITYRWGPRTLDIDILWYNGEHIRTPLLTIPHPEIHKRPFVYKPWMEIAPDMLPMIWG